MLSFSVPLAISAVFMLASNNHLVSSFTIMAPHRPATASSIPTSTPQHLVRPNLSRYRSTATKNKSLYATIIGWDDESDSYVTTFDEPSYYDSIFGEQQTPPAGPPAPTATTFINNNLSSTSASTTVTDTLLLHNMDKIARLAVAFSPPNQPIKLEDINQIHIINVTNRYIEISVVVCDESQCVTLLVPISFRHDCSTSCSSSYSCSNSSDQCILDSIFELDIEAQHMIEHQQQQRQQEQQQEWGVGYSSALRP